MKKVSENTKVTLSLGQLKKLVSESPVPPAALNPRKIKRDVQEYLQMVAEQGEDGWDYVEDILKVLTSDLWLKLYKKWDVGEVLAMGDDY